MLDFVVMKTTLPLSNRWRMAPMTRQRAYRLRRGVPLIKASVCAELSLVRASDIERHPDRARPGELERLRAGVDMAVKEDRARS
jgi:hypothetical protein